MKTPDLTADLKAIASNSAPARKVPELTLHPLCTLIPPCTEEEFKELKEDIKKNGLQVPIKLFEGKILDGRSRHRACVELEKEWFPVDFKAEDFTRTTDDALACVISMNVKRRHLTASGEELETGCSFTHHNYHKFTPLCWECFHTPERRKATAYHWRKPSKFAEVRRRMEERIAANAPKLTRGRIL